MYDRLVGFALRLRASVFRSALAACFASTLPAMAFAVTSTTTLTITPSTTVNAGTVVTMTANVSNGSPVRGQVDFCLASAAHCTGGAVLASVQTTTLGDAVYRSVPGTGMYRVKAVFHGTGFVLGSSSPTQTMTVIGTGSYATATSIGSTGNPGNYTLTATVAGFGRLPASGVVDFLNTSAANAQVGSSTLGAITAMNFTVPSITPQSVSGGKVMKGDFNNDGILDLISTGLYSDGISIALGVGDGTFQTPVGYSAGTKPFGIGLADLNGDGNLDIVVSNYNPIQPNPGYMTVLLGNGDGTFQTAVTYNGGLNSGGVALGDFNGDGFLDVALMNSGNVGIFIGNGDGTFQAQVSYNVPQGIPVAVGDFNEDGNLDLVVGNQNTSIGILLGNGDGTFQTVINYPAGYTAEGIVVSDFNSDGQLDIATANFDDNTMGVLLGVGDGTFPTNVSYSAGSNSQPYDIAAGDFNGDGVQDLVVSGLFGSTSSHVFLGVGDGTFQPSIGADTGFYNLGVTAGDFNGDGLDDFAATNYIDASIGVELSQLAVTAMATGVSVPGPTAQNVDASYGGDAPHAASLSSTVALQPLPSSTSLAVSPASAVPGATITFTATVAPAPSGGGAGTVSFYRGSNLLAVVNVTGSSASYAATTLPGGRSTVSATYSGNGVLGSSTSNSVTVFVGPQSALALSASSSTTTVGTPIKLTATATNSPSGTVLTPGSVTFNYQETANGGSVSGSFGSAQLNSAGLAVLTVQPGAGVYAITAAFPGTTAVGPSASSTQTVTVNGNASYLTTTGLTFAGSVGDYALTATVTGFGLLAPAGTVSFLNTTNANQSVASAVLDPSTLVQSLVAPAPASLPAPGINFVASGDFNGDGIADLATADTDGTVQVRIGLGNGAYQESISYPVSSSLIQIITADVNNDGKLDLAAVSPQDGTVVVLLGNGDGTFQIPLGTQILTTDGTPDFIAAADLNGDGDVDVIVVNQNDENVSIFLGNGDGTFQSQQTYATGSGPNSLVVADFNGDGAPDLAVSNQNDSTISILLSNGDGTFQTQSTVTFPYGDASGMMAAGSLRHNGIIDLVAPDLYDPAIFVYLGNGDGTFASPVTYNTSNSGTQVTLFDLDHNGTLDLVALYPTQVAIFSGNGDGTFGNEATITAGTELGNLAIADLNNDGLADFVTSSESPGSLGLLLGQQSVTATANAVYVTGSGTQSVDARYPADALHGSSLSNTVPLTPSIQEPSSIALNASPLSGAPGTLVVLTATVSPTPTGVTLGSVGFYNGSTLLGTSQVGNHGIATLSTTALPGGQDAITAVYSGNAGYGGSISAPITITVSASQRSTITVLTASSLTPTYGDSVTLTAVVSPAPAPNGTAAFYNGKTLLGTEPLSAQGSAHISLTTLPIGTDFLRAIFSGSTGYLTSMGGQTVVVRAVTISTLTASPTTQLVTLPIVLTAKLASTAVGAATGTFSFFDGSKLLGTSAVQSNGLAVFNATTLGDGKHSVSATYSGDGDFLPSMATADADITVADLNLELGGDKNQSVVPGGAVTYNFPLSPLVTSTFLYDVSLTATGLPPGASYTFSPASIPAGSGTLPVALTIQTAKNVALLELMDRSNPKSSSRGWVALALFVLLPLAGSKRLRGPLDRKGAWLMLLLAGTLSLTAVTGLSGCGSGGGFFGDTAKRYTITIAATSGGLVRTSTVQLNLQ